MEKICQICQKVVEQNVNFCPNCGSSQFYINESNETEVLQAPPSSHADEQYSYENYNPQMGQEQEQEQKKGWGVRICITIAAIIVASLIGRLAGVLFVESANKMGISGSENSNYTKGEIVDGVYQNEWANIQFEITDKWPVSSDTMYEMYENETTECGFASANELTGKQFIISFENLNSLKQEYTAEEYMNAVTTQLFEQFEANGYVASISEKYNTQIAGEDYVSVTVSILGTDVVEAFFVSEKDGYMICIMCITDDIGDVEAAISMIEPM